MEALEKRIMNAVRASTEFWNVEYEYTSKSQCWLNNCIKTCVFNTEHLMMKMRPTPMENEASEEILAFHAKMQWWRMAVKRLSKSNVRGMGWQRMAQKAALDRDSGSFVLWVPQEARVVPLSGYTQEGGYGKVRKVRIEGMDLIPEYVLLAGKTSKAKSLVQSRIQRSTEALVCPLNHPCIITFVAVHSYTMEAYTQWWNGGSLHEMFKLNSKVSPTVPWDRMNEVRQLTEEDVRKLSLYRRHRLKLAWALVYVGSLLQNLNVLHNDLSPMNILFHFPEMDKDKICIGICDWEIASRVHEGAPSHYGYATTALKEENMKTRWWVAPELFYTFGPPNSETSIENMQASHKYTVESDSFSFGKLGLMMYVQEADKDLFQDDIGVRYFEMKLREMTNPDPKKRPTCGQTKNKLMEAPWRLMPPEAVFRTEF